MFRRPKNWFWTIDKLVWREFSENEDRSKSNVEFDERLRETFNQPIPQPIHRQPQSQSIRSLQGNKYWCWKLGKFMNLLPKEWLTPHGFQHHKDATRANMDGCYSCAGPIVLFDFDFSFQRPSRNSFWTGIICLRPNTGVSSAANIFVTHT